MLDIHNHIVFGVDDGARSIEESLILAEEAAADGITKIISTPHITPGVYPFPFETYRQNLAMIREAVKAKGIALEIREGAEVLYTPHTPRLYQEGKVPTLAGSRFMLTEFAPDEQLAAIEDALQHLVACGVVPVIAHLERCFRVRKTDEVRRLKESYGALVQINARSLTYKQSLLRRKYFDGLFTEGLVDFIASDTHALPGRETCMTLGMKNAKEKYGLEFEVEGYKGLW